MLARFGADRLGWRQLFWERFGEQKVDLVRGKPPEFRTKELEACFVLRQSVMGSQELWEELLKFSFANLLTLMLAVIPQVLSIDDALSWRGGAYTVRQRPSLWSSSGVGFRLRFKDVSQRCFDRIQ